MVLIRPETQLLTVSGLGLAIYQLDGSCKGICVDGTDTESVAESG